MPKHNRAPTVATAGKPLNSLNTRSVERPTPAVNPMAAVLLAQADSLESQAATLRALAHQAVGTPPKAEWLDEAQLTSEYGLAKGSADARAIPRTRLGRKNRWNRADVEASIKTAPVQPRTKGVRTCRVESGDEIDALIASGSVRL